MNLIYLDEYHFINSSILRDDKQILVKVGVVGFIDLAKFKKLYPKSMIIAYEADPDNYYKECSESFKYLDKFINCAVGKNKQIQLNRFTNNVSNSVFPRHKYDPNCVYKDTIFIRSIDIDNVMAENKLDYIDILVLNCEGGELDIMKSLYNENTRNKIGQICVSFHDPRIYPTKEKEKIFNDIGRYYHIIKGTCPKGNVPDYLMIRKV